MRQVLIHSCHNVAYILWFNTNIEKNKPINVSEIEYILISLVFPQIQKRS